MRVARYHVKGGPEVFQIEDLPTPTPGEGEVLVRVEATGVAYADILRRGTGYYPIQPTLPHVPGTLAVATVEAVAPDVDPGWVGKRVLATVHTGSYAEQGLAKVDTLRALPDGVDPVEALTVASGASTAGMLLRVAAKLQPGESVFVPAATGSTGFLVAQLARIWGAGRVFGAASSDEKRAIVADFGAIPIDYTKDDWSKDVIEQNDGQGVDVAFELTGGPVFYETFNAVRDGGRVVNYGNVTDTDSPINPRALLRRNQTLVGFFNTRARGLYPDVAAEVERDIDALLLAGELKVPIGETFTLEQVADSHRVLEERRAVGKVILLPNG